MCTSFKRALSELRNSVAMVAGRMSTTLVDPESLASSTASHLITLDKCPGVHPIDVGEVVRHIIGKAILYVVGQGIRDAAGPLQLSAGQMAEVKTLYMHTRTKEKQFWRSMPPMHSSASIDNQLYTIFKQCAPPFPLYC